VAAVPLSPGPQMSALAETDVWSRFRFIYFLSLMFRQLQLPGRKASRILAEDIKQNYLLARADVRNQTGLQMAAEEIGLSI